MSMQNTAVFAEPALDAPLGQTKQTRPSRLATPGLRVRVASSIDEIASAWRLVFDSYKRIDLISDNPFGLHTHPHAIRPSTSVIAGYLNDEPVSTLTIIHDDRRAGLPLDRVFNRQLNLLRRLGRPLVEVGLFADRREFVGRALESIFEMMRFVYWNACFHQADVLIGCHPHHAGFYIKTFGFDLIGPVLPYAAVRGKPAVLLRCSTMDHLNKQRLPRGVAMFHRNGLPADTFDSRFQMSPETVWDTEIGEYLRQRGILSEGGIELEPSPFPICEPMPTAIDAESPENMDETALAA